MRAALARSFNRACMWFGIVGTALILVHWLSAGSSHIAQQQPRPSYPERLAAAHGCWSGPAPADVRIPTHVIAQRDGHVTAEYLGPVQTGLALRQIFHGDDNGLTVFAFCR